MKKLLSMVLTMAVSLVIVFLVPSFAIEAQEVDKEATYKVQITVTYNAVPAVEATEIARRVLAEHGEAACKVNVTIKKRTEEGFIVSDNFSDGSN